jgi:7,8-dihydropterin-6-yl-methyl-4-(beta-D-ribofuranosyl)aminobenzene 5'-phosphate synthase
MNERRLARLALSSLIGLICLLAIGCAPSGIASPMPERATATPTPPPTFTATPIPTATSVPTATLTSTPRRAAATPPPTFTATPVPTGTSVPTATPTPPSKQVTATLAPMPTATAIPTRTPVPTATPTTLPSPTPTPEPTPTEAAEKLNLTILYDNNEYDERLETAWGFSCLVEGLEKTILFDTGGDSAMLLRNMRKLGIDPQIVEAVTVYLPECLPESIKDTVRESGAELVEVREAVKICERAYSTGELGDWIKEQALVIETDEGLVVITGCAHPGVVNVVREAKRLRGGDVHLVLGGFHLCWLNVFQIKGIVDGVKEEGVEMVAPCHCSGDLARSTFEKAYGENFILVGVGRKLEIEGE